jgi:LacI family transcriptional regulator
MKSLSAIAKDLGVSVATVSYVYHGKWREKRIRPELAARVMRELELHRAGPDALGRQLQSGRTQTVGVLLPHLDQPYLLHLLAGIEERLGEADHMVLLGCAHWQWEQRQARLLERMLSRRVDAVLMDPRPAADLEALLMTTGERAKPPLVFVDNYLPQIPAARVLSDNRWGALEAVRTMIANGRRRIVFLGADPDVAALLDRFKGFRDAMDEAELPCIGAHILWRKGREQASLAELRSLLKGPDRPDALFATSLLRLFPVLEIMDELGLRHPNDVLLAGFDQPVESWGQDIVRRVITEPLLSVVQDATAIGKQAVELALASMAGENLRESVVLIRPALSWKHVGTANIEQ